MAERIEQQFLIDAAAAIQTLQQLDQGFQTFEKRLNSVAQSVQNFNNGIKGNASAVTSYNRAVQSAANAINKSNQGTKQLINTSAGLSNVNAQYGQIIGNLAEMYDRSKKFGITLETLSRVALTQALVRGYNSARDAIAEAAREAAAFEQKVALISTIAQGTGNEAIANGVKDIAGQFNIPLLETAEGVYNALSNQVGKFGETLEFTAEAAKFAKATNSSLADSVDLLSAVLNSYGLTARDTNRVASILFTTIDEGRVVASELGNSMGRILPSATQLGVTMEETAAAIALISQQGLNSAETLTRVNAMFTTLLKPSEALKERYKELDVASGEMGIRTFGLAKFLDMLTKSGTMASAELSKLAPNIRGFGGIVGVTSKGPEAFADAIERVNKAVANDKATEAYTKATATNAEVVSRAFQNGKLALEEYGEFIVATFADAVRAVDSFTEDNQAAIDTVETVIASFAGMGTSLGATTIGIFAAANAMRALNFVMVANPALGVVAAFGALTGATLAYIEQAKRAKIDAALEKFHKAEEASTKRLAEVTKQAAKTFDESYSKIRTSVGGLLYAAAPAKKRYDQTISDIIRQNTKLEDSTDLALDRVVDARRKYVSELSRAAQDADDQVRRSQQQIASLRAGQADRTFDASLTGLSDSAHVLKLTQQAAALANKAAADLEKAAQSGSNEQINAARVQFERANDAAREAEDVAKRTGNRALEASVAKDLNAISNRQIEAEQRLIDLQLKRKKVADEERRTQEETLKNLERQAKIVLENSGFFNSKGERFSDTELADRTKKRNLALNELISAQFKKGDFDLADVLGLAKFTSDFNAELSKGAGNLQTQLGKSSEAVAGQIQQALNDFNADPAIAAFKRAAQMEGGLLNASDLIAPEELEHFGQAIEQTLQDALQGFREGFIKTAESVEKFGQLSTLLDSVDTSTGAKDRQVMERVKSPYGEVNRQFRESAMMLREFGKDAEFSGKEVDLIKGKIAQLDRVVEDFNKNMFDRANYKDFLPDQEALYNALDQVRQIIDLQEVQKANAGNEDAPDRVEAINRLLEQTKQAAPTAQTSEVSSNLRAAVNYSAQLARNTVSAAQAMQAYAIAANRLDSGGAVQTAYFGNAMMHYFANGGQARGKDTIHAMIDPGESIINSRSTARFFSQIQAMNAGQIPVFRAQQGSVTNVGDINVTVSGGSSGGQTARVIATELRRELRRGTSRL